MAQIQEWFKRQFGNPQLVALVLIITGVLLTIGFFGSWLLPVLISLVIAYFLDSLIAFMQRRGSKRLPAVILVFTSFLTVFVASIVICVPLLIRQVEDVQKGFDGMVRKVEKLVEEKLPESKYIDREKILNVFAEFPEVFEAWLTGAAKPPSSPTLVGFATLPNGEQVEIDVKLSQPTANAVPVTGLVAIGKGLLTGVPDILRWLVYLILIPLLVFFMLKDKYPIQRWFVSFLPEERALAHEVWTDVDRQIGNYVRGKMWEILIIGGTTYITLLLFGVEFAPLLGLLVGLSVIFPYVGATLVTFPVALFAYAQLGDSSTFTWVMIAYFIIQALDGNVLVPLLFSEVVSLHPIAIISSILVFGGLGGFWGVFFAIPLATVVQAIIKAWPRKSRSLPASVEA